MAEKFKVIDIMNYPNYTQKGQKMFFEGGFEYTQAVRQYLQSFILAPITTEEFVKQMDEAGYEKVFLCTIKMGSYKFPAMNIDFDHEMVYEEVRKFPDRLVGICGYNPLFIVDSLKAIEQAVKDYGFKGVFVMSLGWGIAATDRRMYPCYAKCVELDIPFSMQIGQAFEALPSEPGRPIYVDQVAVDFPELRFICSHTGYPWCEEVVAMAWKHKNVYIDTSAHAPRTIATRMKPLLDFMDSRAGRPKVIYGTNGWPLKMALEQFMSLPLKEETKTAVLSENAVRVFKL